MTGPRWWVRAIARQSVATWLCLALGWSAAATAQPAVGRLEVEDYFRLQRVSELALSPDGIRLLYVVEPAFPQTDPAADARSGQTRLRMAYLQRLDAAAQAPQRIEALADAQAISWIPGGARIAYLGRSGQTRQLFAHDLDTATTQALTQGDEEVEQYRFSDDGSALAYATVAKPLASRSLYERIRNETRGIVIDEPTVKVYDYLNPRAGGQWQPRVTGLWVVARAGDAPRQVPVPGAVMAPAGGEASFHWAPGASALSVTYVADDLPPSFIGSLSRSSLGVYSLGDARFQVVGASREAADGQPAVRYLGGEWWPDGRLLVRRYFEHDPWGSSTFQAWTTLDAAVNAVADPALRWREIELGAAKRMQPDADGRIRFEYTVQGRRGLFQWREGDAAFAPVAMGVPGSQSQFRFSADATTQVFVGESLVQPPEIYLRRAGAAPVRITRLNDGIAARVAYDAEEVRWSSRDGVAVKGWLLRPHGQGDRPLPMLTHVHGGPGGPVTDTFAPTLRLWTYPFEVQASRGMAVFFPNYRGTMGYGKQVAFPSHTHLEPADDVLTGIAHLVQRGVADARKLAISGHSHGAWLGPWVMTRADAPRFVAASFAEGSSNRVNTYLTMSSELNRYTHDAIMGASLFDDPARYIETSPDLYFDQVRAATLVEAGAWSQPLGMVGYAKAASYRGIPNEFVIYPNTGHNPDRADVAREIAMRNLDWFEFWMSGREHAQADALTQAQYARWRGMRAARSPAQ